MFDSASVPLLLLKKESDNDEYGQLFKNTGYDPIFVPVLEHHLQQENLAKLEAKITGGSFNSQNPFNDNSSSYGGIIFTSQRSVEAFASVIAKLREKKVALDGLFDPGLPIYVVGPATTRALQALNLPCDILGEDSGNGEALADYILEKHGLPRKRPLLFLVGEQRRDIIPTTLQSNKLNREKRLKVEELTVYDSSELKNFQNDFTTALLRAKDRNPKKQWIVVFSPTGCKAMLEGIGLLDPQDDIKAKLGADKRTTRIAAIGPTTQLHLQKGFGLEADAVATKPSPEGLSEAIHAAEQGSDSFASRVMRKMSVSGRSRATSKSEVHG